MKSLLPNQSLKQLVYAVNSLPKSPLIVCCGVYEGGDVQVMLETKKWPHIIAIDSFEGVSHPTELDYGCCLCGGEFMSSYEQFIDRFRGTNLVTTYKQWITKESLSDVVVPRTINMLWLDLDMAEPTDAALSHFLPKMDDNGIVMTHDYENQNYPGIKKVCDKYGKWRKLGGTLARLER